MKNTAYLRSSLSGLVAAGYIAAIAQAALSTGLAYILFPELGALAHDIFEHPAGRWASAPVLLVFTPLATAVPGVWIAQHMHYGVLSVSLGTAIGIGVVAALRSPIAPAISAGLLPVVFDIRSWWYPPSIWAGTATLALAAFAYRRWFRVHGGLPAPTAADRISDIIERAPSGYGWVPFFFGFVVACALLAQVTGWRAILVPPLVVTGFEMFAHADICPWTERPGLLLSICILTAACGLFFRLWLGTGPLAAIGIMIGSIAILKTARLHVPPAIAIGLLAILMHKPGYGYPVAVGVGGALLTVIFLIYRRHRLRAA
ncbi:MAG: HPP family protein [Gammaproteobacteria bacterium]|nr:HPP family protein [Gammaproteobacteria bacterium]